MTSTQRARTAVYRSTTLSFALCLVTIVATAAAAQTRLLTGRVYDDATQLGVPGATISVVEGTGAAQANVDGRYRLTLPSTSLRLRVRGIGYKEREIRLDSALTTLDMALTRQALQLNEVVVTGSGTTQERQHVATAVSTVSGAELSTAPAASLVSALQGKVVGASINMNSGAPGGGGQIQIRGVTSVLGNGEPLFVVDGVPFSNAAFSAGIGAVTKAGSLSGTLDRSGTAQDNAVNRLSDLSTADVENIQILKGAAASAIYGSQATNGVVLITTKRGRGSVSRFQLHQRAGTNMVDRLLGSRHFTHATLSELDSATATQYCPSDPCPYYDYQGALYGQHDLAYETSLSLSGGTDLTNYFVSINDKNDPGTMMHTGALRQNVRLNLDQSLGSRWTTSVSAAIYRSETARGISNNDNTFTSPINVFAYTPAVADLRALGANGRPVDNVILDNLQGPGSNPFNTLASIDNSEDVWRQTGSSVVRYNAWSTPRQTLNVSVTGGFDRYDAEGQSYSPNYLKFGTDTTLPGTAVQTAAVVRQYSSSASAVHTYTPTGAGRRSFINSLTTSAGFQYSDLATNRYSIVARGLLPTLENVDQGTPALNQLKSVVRNEAVYGNEEFLALNEKFSASARVRAERSSVDGDPHRWFYWPALAAAYRFVDLIPHADEIKLRASTGVSGNQPLYGLRDNGLAPPGIYDGRNSLVEPAVVGNGAIEPERMRESEIGVDASLLGNRIGLEASYYNRTITKLLLQAALAATTGFGARYINGGTLTTAGVEVAVNVLAIHTDQFSWSSRAQYYASQSRLVTLAPGVSDFPLGATGFAPQYGIGRIAQGYRSTLIWGNKVVVDSSGKHTVVAPLADANPYFQMAFGNEFTLHGLALHTLVDWRKGGSVADLTQSQFDAGSNSWDYDKPSPDPTIGTKLGAYRVNSWQNGNNASVYIQDGSYVKLREVTLTYTIPPRYTQRFLHSRDARVSFSGRNLYTWTKYWSFDPEVNNFGNQSVDRFTDAFPYPPARSFVLGVDIGY
jgi:TonB-linked SusC/RagA family outer membrane protein